MLLKENYFISLYGCFEASITLSKGRWGISWVQEKYFLSSMYFKTCLNHIHADHMWKLHGQKSPMLSKVRTTVSQMAWLDKSHHPYAGLQCYSWGSAPAGLSAHVLQPSVNGTWLHWRVQHLWLRTWRWALVGLRVSAGTLEGDVTLWSCISALLWASALKKGEGTL